MIRFLIFVWLIAFCPSLCHAQIGARRFNVRRFGAVANGVHDDAPAIARAIAAAVAAPGRSIVFFPPGRYRLGSLERPTDAAYVTVTGARGLTIQGTPNTTLVSSDVSHTFIKLVGCRNIEMDTLTLDANPLPYTQGIIDAVNPKAMTFDVHVDPGFDPPDRPDLAKVTTFLPFTDPTSGSWLQAPWPPRILSRQLLSPGHWRFHVSGALAPGAQYVGKPWLLWENHFNSWGVDVDGCRGCLLDGVNVETAGGGGFSFWQNVGQVALYDCRIGVLPGSGRLIAAGGGSMAFHNRGTVILDHCDFSGIDDDGMNIGTSFVHVLAKIGSRTVQVEGNNVLFSPGDTVALWDWTKKRERMQARIIAASARPDGSWQLTLDRPVQVLHTGAGAPSASREAQENDDIDRLVDFQDAGRLMVHDSSISVMRARCILVKASNSVIENNRFYNTHMPAILAGPEFYWGEGPAVHNLLIRGNRFTDVDTSNIRVGVFDSPFSEDNRGVVIEGNVFSGYGANILPTKTYIQGNVIDVTNTDGVTIEGNQIGPASPTVPLGVPRLLATGDRHLVVKDNTGLR